MKNKTGRKSKKRVSKQPGARREIASKAATPHEQVIPITTTTLSPTDPRVLLELADQEPDQQELAEYVPVIEKLRSKNFSYREIAEWFSDHGVDLDHNTIYRLYTKHLSDYEAAMEEKRADQEEQDEAYRSNR